MPVAKGELPKPTIVGRSSSHFSRVTRIFAAELGVDCSFQVVRDIMSSEPGEYGGNPALKVPSLVTARGTWFGALNVCRELERASPRKLRVVWPEDLDQAVSANAQELVVQAMSTAVSLLMGKAAGGSDGNAHQTKMRTSLVNSVFWLEENAKHALASLPSDRDLSFLEITLFCFVTHLNFREVLATGPYRELNAFCERMGARPSAGATEYRFDT